MVCLGRGGAGVGLGGVGWGSRPGPRARHWGVRCRVVLGVRSVQV